MSNYELPIDVRDCPKCKVRMEPKHGFSFEEFGDELWQCPHCKNIEVIAQRIGRGYEE